MIKSFNFGLIFVKRLTKLLRYLNSNGTTFSILLFLLLLSMLQEIAIYNVGMITGSYYKVLGDKDKHKFWIQTIQSLFMIIALAVIKSSKEYVASTIYIEWRKFLTKKIHSLYFMGLSYYRVNVIETENDNYDQRISQDVEKWAKHLSLVLPDLIVSPFTIAFYAIRSYSTIGLIGPLGCFSYFILSTIVNKLLISKVVNLFYFQEKCEGDFRFQHLHVRNKAESIAFIGGHNFEYIKSESTFQRLLAVQENLITKEFNLKCSVYLFDYLGSIVSFMILSVPLFAGSYDSLSPTDLSEFISQNAFVTMYLINCFTKLIDTSTEFTIIAATTHRIAEVIESLSCKPPNVDTSPSNSSLNKLNSDYSLSLSESRTYFKFSNVAIKVPQSNRKLITKLNFKLSHGSNLLISGPSGTCKTSILRVLKGIWNETSGTVERFLPVDDPNIVLFLPQKPVMTTGCLLEQITYPLRYESIKYQAEDIAKEQIIDYMKFVDLNQMLTRVDNDLEKEMDFDWNECLSPGELQRLAFVRLFYHRPVVAVLDEATAAISLDLEHKIYEQCKKLKITLISSGHRESLEQYHSYALRITHSEDSLDSAENNYFIQRL